MSKPLNESSIETKDFLASAPANGRVLAILGFHKIGELPHNGWEAW